MMINAVNTLRPELNVCHFADNIFKCIFSKENFWIANKSFIEVCSSGFNWQQVNIGSDNDLLPNIW